MKINGGQGLTDSVRLKGCHGSSLARVEVDANYYYYHKDNDIPTRCHRPWMSVTLQAAC